MLMMSCREYPGIVSSKCQAAAYPHTGVELATCRIYSSSSRGITVRDI